MIDVKDIQGVKDFLYYRDVRQDIRDYVLGRKELVKAETTQWSTYDQHFKWLRTEVTGVSGIPNHGKSVFMLFLAGLKMYYDNWKIAVYSPETTPPEFFYANIIHTLTGRNIFIDGFKPTVDQLHSVEPILENNLFLCEPEKMPTFKGIMERFKDACETHGVDMFIIDPFNCLEREWEHSKRDDRYVGDFLDTYKDFVKQTGTCGVVVMHPNATVETEKDSVDFKCPNTYKLAGGAMWYNKLDNLMFVHRPHFISDPQDSQVLIRHGKIKKRQLVGSGGDAYVDYNFKTNRYVYLNNEPEFSDIGESLVLEKKKETEEEQEKLPF